MAEKINIYVAVPPEYSGEAARLGCTQARMIYRIGRGFRLYRSLRGGDYRGGLMVLDTGSFTGGGPAAALIDDILAECAEMDFSGIVIDSGGKGASPPQVFLSKKLAAAAAGNGLTFFVPETLAQCGNNAIVRISAALSGGTLRRCISEAVERYGAHGIALEIERVCMDFTLPARSGEGKAISHETLLALKTSHNAAAFFSTDLAVNYFTYRDKKESHFVLYDNLASIKHKLSAAENAGIKNVFLFYPHVADIYDKLFIAGQLKKQ